MTMAAGAAAGAAPTTVPGGRHGVGSDLLLIAVVVALSAALYLPWLGWHGDDWAMRWYMEQGTPGNSLWDVFQRSFFSNSVITRPALGAYATLLYALFGFEALPHHLVNHAMIAGVGMLLYLVLRRLGQPRAVALAVALLYLLLPHYATDRLWWVCMQVPLAMAGWLLALYAELRAIEAAGWPRHAWRGLALLALVVSAMAYEITMPLFLLHPLVVAWHRRQLDPTPTHWREIVPFALLQLALLVAAGLFKLAYTARLVEATPWDHVAWFARFLAAVGYTIVAGDFGLRLPVTVASIVGYSGAAALVGVALAVGVLVFVALRRLPWEGPAAGPLFIAGVVVFLGGYSIFFLTFTAGAPTPGVNNRTAMAAMIGLALCLVAVIAWLSRRRRQAAPQVFAAGIAVLCATGTLVINGLGMQWGAASAAQRTVLRELQAALPTLPTGTTLLLDGLCPYRGVAPVFEAWWDTAGALRLAYGDNSLMGQVVTTRVRLRPDGLYTSMWGDPNGPYAYDRLLVWDVVRRRAQPLRSQAEAERYFAAVNPGFDSGCRRSREGEGEAAFGAAARRFAWPP